ncbi:hypothetical protein, partial [Anaerotruncus massiliensis (ex Togo et al. 2019)]|uniref:hypothetical protein n=1 Tax=Anaerotruncus massiliensis (ex Togo et al. 2019) TaxID=1673720 RepID=UPI0027BA4F4F
MLLTVDTSLGDAILARYGGFVYSISDGAQMLLLQHQRQSRINKTPPTRQKNATRMAAWGWKRG